MRKLTTQDCIVPVTCAILTFGYYWFTNLYAYLEFRYAFSIPGGVSMADSVLALAVGDMFGILRLLIYPTGIFLALFYAETRWMINVPSEYRKLSLLILGGGLAGYGVAYVPATMLGGAYGVLQGPIQVILALIGVLVNLLAFSVGFAFLGFTAVALGYFMRESSLIS